MKNEIQSAFKKIIEKKSRQYCEELFKHNNRSFIVLAAVLFVEQLLYGLLFTEYGTRISETHIFTAVISLMYLIVFLSIFYRNRNTSKPFFCANIVHISYMALLLSIAIYRVLYAMEGNFSIPVIYVALLYGSAFLFYLPPGWSLMLYGLTLCGFAVLGQGKTIDLMNPTFLEDIVANNFLAWCASMMAYYRFVQQVDAIILIEEKNFELKYLSEMDALTNLYNRRKIDALSKEIHQSAIENGWSYGVIIMDVDHFKDVNDNFGHPIGDRVLQELANVIRASLREEDAAGRWGGEEFMIISEMATLNETEHLAEKIRVAVETFDFKIGQQVTCSIGVSAYETGIALDEVIHHADKALYISKAEGRNRVTHYLR